jgi:hypothetical protein
MEASTLMIPAHAADDPNNTATASTQLNRLKNFLDIFIAALPNYGR